MRRWRQSVHWAREQDRQPPRDPMYGTGILPSQSIQRLAETGVIRAERPLEGDQVQPASLDLRLGTKAWRMRASFLPGPKARVSERIADLALHEIDLRGGAVLETGCVY